MAPFFWPYFCLSYDIRHVSMHKHKHLSRLMLENEKAWNCFERDQTDARLAENMLISSTLLKSKSKWGDSSRELLSLAEPTEPHFNYPSWSTMFQGGAAPRPAADETYSRHLFLIVKVFMGFSSAHC